jgi:hypothetical protein
MERWASSAALSPPVDHTQGEPAMITSAANVCSLAGCVVVGSSPAASLGSGFLRFLAIRR